MDEESGGSSNSFSTLEAIKGTDHGDSTSGSRCRLCADSRGNLVSIFSDEGIELHLAYNLNKLLPFVIHPLDNMPQEVCKTCIQELNAACSFVNKCISSEAKLRSLLRIRKQDDGLSFKELQNYSSHWHVADDVKKMGHSQEIHEKRTKRLLLDSEEEKNERVKRMKYLDKGCDAGESNQSFHLTEDIDEMDANGFPHEADITSDGSSVDGDAVGMEHSPEVDERNTSISESVLVDHHLADDSNAHDENIKYLCKYCGEGFPWKADLFNHQSNEHSELVNRCVYCGKVFYDKGELETHESAHEILLPPGLRLRKKVSKPKRRKKTMLAQNTASNQPDSIMNKENNKICYYCNLIFPTFRMHRKHIRTMHKVRLPCRFCPITSVSIYHHRLHEYRHMRRAMTCLCKKKFHFEEDYRDHALIHMHENGLKCEICGESIDCEQEFAEHIMTHDGESNYLCEECGEGMESFFLFRVHKLGHMYPNMHRCVLCNFCFTRAEDLDNHLEDIHHTRKVQCGTCGEEFVSMDLLKEHRAKQNCNNVSCKDCGKIFPCVSKLRVHAEVHSSENNYLCDQCGKSFKRKENLRVHLHTAHIPSVPCDVCGRQFKNDNRLKEHRQRHFTERTLVCSVCQKSFHTKMGLSAHIKNHEDPKVPCPMCGLLFVRKVFMVQHMRRHRVACEICGEIFENTPLLADHQKVHAEGDKQLPSVMPEFPKCQVCGKQFINVQQLRHHLPAHSDERPFKCDLCEKRYRRARDLTKHTSKKHSEPKPYHCSYCPCTFMTEQMMIKHENGHTQGKPFNCALCGIGFWSPLHLEKHLAKHADKKTCSQYQCKDCGKSFPSVNSLASHRSTHAKLMNFKCPYCPRKFSRRGYMMKHRCPLKPRIEAASSPLQGSVITGGVATITVDGNVLHHVPIEVPGGGENLNRVSESVDFYKHLKTVTKCTFTEVSAPNAVVVESSDEEEYMGPLHPHLLNPHSSKTIQLVEDIPVYIRKRLFENLPLSTISSTTLARNLLDLVFTETALRTCSVKGQRQNSRVIGKREPLCPLGTAAIIAFVQKNNDALGRPHIKSSDLVMAMGHRLNELRRRPPVNPVVEISPMEVTMDITESPILEIEIY